MGEVKNQKKREQNKKKVRSSFELSSVSHYINKFFIFTQNLCFYRLTRIQGTLILKRGRNHLLRIYNLLSKYQIVNLWTRQKHSYNLDLVEFCRIPLDKSI